MMQHESQVVYRVMAVDYPCANTTRIMNLFYLIVMMAGVFMLQSCCAWHVIPTGALHLD